MQPHYIRELDMLKKVELFLLRADTEATTMREKKKNSTKAETSSGFRLCRNQIKTLESSWNGQTGHHSSPGYFPEDIMRNNNHAFVASNEPQPTSSHSKRFYFFTTVTPPPSRSRACFTRLDSCMRSARGARGHVAGSFSSWVSIHAPALLKVLKQ